MSSISGLCSFMLASAWGGLMLASSNSWKASRSKRDIYHYSRQRVLVGVSVHFVGSRVSALHVKLMLILVGKRRRLQLGVSWLASKFLQRPLLSLRDGFIFFV